LIWIHEYILWWILPSIIIDNFVHFDNINSKLSSVITCHRISLQLDAIQNEYISLDSIYLFRSSAEISNLIIFLFNNSHNWLFSKYNIKVLHSILNVDRFGECINISNNNDSVMTHLSIINSLIFDKLTVVWRNVIYFSDNLASSVSSS
jgi:hypothetical protein